MMLSAFDVVVADPVQDSPSLNHSYVCAQVMRQLLQDQEIQPLPALTLAIDKGLTPDISVFPKAKLQPDFFADVLQSQQLPLLAIDIVSAGQRVQEILTQATLLLKAGIKIVWVVEPYGRSIFVLTEKTKALFHAEPVICCGIRVDFAQVFGT